MTSATLKTLTAAALIAVAAGSASYAATMDYNYIIPGHASDLKSVVDLDLVRASDAGTISIYDFSQGSQGAFLGSAAIHAGANENVKVEIMPTTARKVLIVLTENGKTTPVATSTLRHMQTMDAG
ncbi:hypothetical protein [Celeribacter neptunius]|uniref:Uncharacterized protein n=1 Tax=Celeribacter neptunius TaxID=588602 RepID=A0A1I3KAT6_9RHOB|nr:hypothetical protein [Celeribacter neptunius]SFI69593.1 hypothetical protein SAMN04487991_0629 [Celeribacter neptunius]